MAGIATCMEVESQQGLPMDGGLATWGKRARNDSWGFGSSSWMNLPSLQSRGCSFSLYVGFLSLFLFFSFCFS